MVLMEIDIKVLVISITGLKYLSIDKLHCFALTFPTQTSGQNKYTSGKGIQSRKVAKRSRECVVPVVLKLI